jgi:hypothetical protein
VSCRFNKTDRANKTNRAGACRPGIPWKFRADTARLCLLIEMLVFFIFLIWTLWIAPAPRIYIRGFFQIQ